jgi:hypothetical protein
MLEKAYTALSKNMVRIAPSQNKLVTAHEQQADEFTFCEYLRRIFVLVQLLYTL